jgi:hypothetical protein
MSRVPTDQRRSLARSPGRRSLRFASRGFVGSHIFAKGGAAFDESCHTSYDTLAFEAVNSVSCPYGIRSAL